jgi:hypothetical protein
MIRSSDRPLSVGRAAHEKQGGGDSKRDTRVFHANLERFYVTI